MRVHDIVFEFRHPAPTVKLGGSPLLKKVQTPEFWNNVCSELTISEAALESKMGSKIPRPDEPLDVFQSMLATEGYFASMGTLPADLMDRLGHAFDQLEAHDLHPVFVFVFDEAWQAIAALKPMFDSIVGECWFLPAIWSWHVKVDAQTAFAPHRDQVQEVLIEDEEHLDYLTVWIPLTDIDHRSSTISLLPASQDPDFEEGTPEIRVQDLQAIRNLQGPKGSVFCWSTQVAHWGTRQTEYGPPRKSIGFYIQKPTVQCIDGPPLDFTQPLSLQNRLAIIGQQIIDYSRTATKSDLEFASQLIQLNS